MTIRKVSSSGPGPGFILEKIRVRAGAAFYFRKSPDPGSDFAGLTRSNAEPGQKTRIPAPYPSLDLGVKCSVQPNPQEDLICSDTPYSELRLNFLAGVSELFILLIAQYEMTTQKIPRPRIFKINVRILDNGAI